MIIKYNDRNQSFSTALSDFFIFLFYFFYFFIGFNDARGDSDHEQKGEINIIKNKREDCNKETKEKKNRELQ